MSTATQSALDFINQMDPWLRERYCHFHANPEEAFDEFETSKWVQEELTKLGYTVKTGFGVTGLVGILENGPGPVVAYRADMDCNAVKELTGLPYASTKTRTKPDGTTVPLAHQCGHDAHTVWLVALGRTMVQFKDSWSGTLVLVAQPAEELVAGAKAMVKDGIWSAAPKPDYLIGQHTGPMPTGVWGSGETLMAGAMNLDFTMHGVGGHGSAPQTTKDPVVAACLAVVQMQTLVSRTVDPTDTAVFTVGAIKAGIDNNVIPDNATIHCNLRYFKDQVRDEMVEGSHRIAKGVSAGQGLFEPEMVISADTTPLVNDLGLVKDVLFPALKRGLPNSDLKLPMDGIMGSEDCQLLIKDLPGTKLGFVFVGTCPPELFKKAQEEGKPSPWSNHSPYYQVDLNALVGGAQSAFLMVHELLKKN